MKIWRVLILSALACIAGCEAPGEGPKADAGRELGAKVLVALGKYRADHRRLPDQLTDLNPKYLDFRPKELGKSDSEGIQFSYRPKPDGTFELSFRYFGPGVNNCHYQYGSSKGWTCSGYY